MMTMVMRSMAIAVLCVVVAGGAYVVRGYALLHDYENGGLSDSVTIVLIYGALVVFVGVCVATAVQVARLILAALLARARHH